MLPDFHTFCPQMNFPSQGGKSEASGRAGHPNLHPMFLRSHAHLNPPINLLKVG